MKNLLNKIAIFAIAILFFPHCIEAQTANHFNTSFYYNPDIVFSNPAGIAFSKTLQGSIGTQFLWVGLSGDDLTNSYMNLAYPLDVNSALGLRGMFFNSSLFQQGSFSFLIGHKVFKDIISIGINANYLFYSYNTEKFQFIDNDDPLISTDLSKNTLSAGFSVLCNPNDWFSLGGSIDHVNRPDISIDNAKFRKYPIFMLGAHVSYFPIIPYFNLQAINKDFLYHVGISKYFINRCLNMNIGINYMKSYQKDIFTEVNIDFSNFRFGYEYLYSLSELNTISSGSHQITFSFSQGGMKYPSKKPRIYLYNPPDTTIYTNDKKVDIRVKVNAYHDTGIEKVIIKLNGNEVIEKRYNEQKDVVLEENINLENRNNRIEIIAYSKEKSKSCYFHVKKEKPNELKGILDSLRNLTDASKDWINNSKSYFVVIGINNYKFKSVGNLEYAVNDAESLKQALQERTFYQLYKELHNENATIANLRNLMQKLTDDKDIDRLIFYFSGHGITRELRDNEILGFLLMHDSNPDSPIATAISTKEIITWANMLTAHHVLFVFDACHSGIDGYNEKGVDKPYILERLVRNDGIHFLTAGTTSDETRENNSYRHGVFTYYLLEALDGRADENVDNLLTLQELLSFIKPRVIEDTEGIQDPQLYKIGRSTGELFIELRKNKSN